MAAVIAAVTFATLPKHEDIVYDTWDVSYEADITNYYWSDIPLQSGVWTYTIDYQSAHHLYTSVYAMDDQASRVYALFYGTGEVFLPKQYVSRSYDVYVNTDEVMVGIEVRGTSEDGRQPGDMPTQVRFTYRPKMTLAYRIYRPFSLLILLCFARFLVRFIRTKDSMKEKRAIFACIILVIFISTPLVINGVLRGADPFFHMRRIDEIANGLQSGYFPVRLQGGWYNDYGYPVGVFYPDLLLYLPAILRVAGIPVWKCLQLYLLMMNFLAVAVSYCCFKRIAKDATIGFIASALYCTSPWYLTGIYLRCAVGEDTAMCFLPIIVAGVWEIICGDRNRKRATAMLVIGYTGVIQSHIHTPVMITIFLLFLACMIPQVLLKKENLIAMGVSAIYVVAINAGVIIPIVDYYIRGIRGPVGSASALRENGISLAQLIMLYPENRIHTGSFVRAQGIAGEMPLTPGIALIFILFLAVFIVSVEKTDNKKRAVILSALACLAVWMSTDMFPYLWLEKHIPVLYGVLGKNIQFQWRYLLAATLALSVLTTVVLKDIEMRSPRRMYIVAICLIVIAAMQAGHLISGWMNTDNDGAYQPIVIKDSSESEYAFGDGHYLPAEAWESDANTTGVISSDPDAKMEGYERKAFTMRMTVRNEDDEAQIFEMPVWNYHGYTISEGRARLTSSERKKLRVEIDPGYSGSVEVTWKEPEYWRLAELVSIIAVAVFVLKHKRKRMICFANA
ncbi:MAG: hypothetical protein IJQ12_07385 [Lachnospiraceae bacterium]|nr:hypothetical protein [Lachnospiraceae bacterium]